MRSSWKHVKQRVEQNQNLNELCTRVKAQYPESGWFTSAGEIEKARGDGSEENEGGTGRGWALVVDFWQQSK